MAMQSNTASWHSSFINGTAILQRNTTTAMPCMPLLYRLNTPLQTVSWVTLPSRFNCMIGRKFAGK